MQLRNRVCSRYLEEQQGDTAGHLDHLLATREQELRALMAEKESLYSQNRQTWGLLEERTQENNQLQVILPALPLLFGSKSRGVLKSPH